MATPDDTARASSRRSIVASDRRPPIARCLAAAALACVIWAETPGFADAQELRRVLVIDSERADRPVWVDFATGFRAELDDRCDYPVDVYFENVDLARFGTESYVERVEAWLTEKYHSTPLDVVVIFLPETYRMASRWTDLLLNDDVSVVFVAVDPDTLADVGRLPNSTGLISKLGLVDTVRLALELFPTTRHLAVVGGPRDSQAYSQFLYEQIVAAFADELEILDLTGLPISEMRERVANLPDHSILTLTSIFSDGDGIQVTHPQLVEQLAPVANAPMFGFVKTELGHGIVGGVLFDGETEGRRTASLVARILEGEPAESIEPVSVTFDILAFDWRELRRWHISPRRLPQGSVVEFRPPTLWEEHRIVMLLTLAVFSLQAASIVALLRSRERRRRINRELHRLSGRLISAQEDERRRVARELHDDVSQRLALLAIELESSRDRADERLERILSRIHSLAGDVHAIAHDLQPPRLDGRGLLVELETFCSQIEKRHGVTIDCRLPTSPLPVPPDAALALYRVAQEAVQNAVKHSGADELLVELAVSSRWASITVSDEGRGFRVHQVGPGRGLGLAGMQERARLLGGWLDLTSVPGEGTTVTAWVPMDAPRTGEATDVAAAHPDR